MRWLLIVLCLSPLACASEEEPAAAHPASPSEPTVATPTALIHAMRDRYDGQWYETLTFVQETIRFDRDGVPDTSTWYEAYAAPGNLRIDIAPLEDGNGILFTDGMRYTMQNGAVAASGPQLHPLLLLGFDIYHLPADEAIRQLDTLGFDLTTMYETTWRGRPTYVVGAAEDDEQASTFWIDKEHLYFTRMIRYVGPERANVQDVRFNNYERLGGGWIAPEVLFTFDGQPVMKETYRDARAGVALDAALFNPHPWRSTAPRHP
jgi:hypothetical protein